MASPANCGYSVGLQDSSDHGSVTGDAVGSLSRGFESVEVKALGKFVILRAMTLAACGRDILEIYGALGIAGTVDSFVSLLLTRRPRVTTMTFIAGHTVFLMYRTLPAMGLYTYKTCAGELRMAFNAGILNFFLATGIAPSQKNDCGTK